MTDHLREAAQALLFAVDHDTCTICRILTSGRTDLHATYCPVPSARAALAADSTPIGDVLWEGVTSELASPSNGAPLFTRSSIPVPAGTRGRFVTTEGAQSDG